MSNSVEKAAAVLGSKGKLARALGVTRAAVGQWTHPGRMVPVEHCPKIERLTNGAVRCEDLRSDIEWWVLRVPAPQQAAEADA